MASDQTEVCRAVTAKGDQKFVGVDYVVSDHNLPIIRDSIAAIECRLYSVTEAGDHWFVLGEVLRMETVREDDPMLFHKGRYGGFAERM
jgi:flavin reductase (DIM6/NTAB) family NADH-FMN oxidoreductase RutF